MQFIACLLFTLQLFVPASTELAEATTSQSTAQRLAVRTLPSQSFGTQVSTEFEKDSKPPERAVSDFNPDGLTLGIAIGTQPMTLRRFGTGTIVMNDIPLKSFGSQAEISSKVPPEEPLLDGLQHWGVQDAGRSELPMEPRVESKNIPEKDTITMSEAMVPHSAAEHEAATSTPSSSSKELLPPNSQNERILGSPMPLQHFGKGTAVPNLDVGWHLAWEAPATDSPGALRAASEGRAGRSMSASIQERIGTEADGVADVMSSFKPILELGRYATIAICIACLAMHLCRSQQIEAKQLLPA